MKRATKNARRRRNFRRWSFVAAFGATTALGVMGWANDGGLGSFFSSGQSKAKVVKASPAGVRPASNVEPAPVKSASRMGRFLSEPGKAPEKVESTSGKSRVALTKTQNPPHVKPAPLVTVDSARPLRKSKQNAFLTKDRGNQYNEPKALAGATAKPLGSDGIAKAPVISPAEIRAADPTKATSGPTVLANQSSTRSPLEIRLPKAEQNDPAPAPTRTTSRSQQTAQRPAPVVKPSSPVQATPMPKYVTPNDLRAKSPARFADAKRPALGPRRILTKIHNASQLQSTDSPSLEIPQPRRLANDSRDPRGVRVAQNQDMGNGPMPNLNVGDHFEIIDEAGKMTVEVGRSRLLKCKFGVFRTAIVDPSIVEAVQFTPTEVSLIGKKAGATQVTFWFENNQEAPQTYLVEVEPSTKARDTIQRRYDHLEDLIADIFPDSKVRITLVADKLVVRGQAKDSAEAAQIMSIIRAQAGGQGQGGLGLGVGGGPAARVAFQDEVGPQAQQQIQVINLLQIPGVQQVALRVKIAELNRTAARGAGIDLDANIEINGDEGAILLQSMLNATAGNAPALIGQADQGNIEVGLRWLQQRGVVRVVSEPTLVTLSGTAATFVAGGEFAVPTVVGTGGLSAVTTDFRAFGAIISFMPTVVDKDRIRLQVSPEFSKIDQELTVGGTPGLQVRAVTTTVEMREGQTLAIAGLLDEAFEADRTSNLPWLDRIVNTRDTTRNETELIILVTPELIHPMEPEEVPPLPGFDVTEPTNKEFFWHSRLEGHPSRQHRSTVWPRLRRRYGAGGSSMISGPFGHGQ